MALTKRVDCGSHSGLLRLSIVPLEALDTYLLACLQILGPALQKTDEIDNRGLVSLLRDGSAQLLIEYLDGVPQGCCVSMVIKYPLLTALEILAIAGWPDKKMMYPNRSSLELLKQWAKTLGCDRIQGYTDEAVLRLWRRIGFTELKRKVGLDL